MTSMPPGGDQYTGSGSWGYRAPDTEPQPPEDQLTRRLKQAAGVVAALLIAVVGYSFLTGGEDTDINPIAHAARRARHIKGMRMTIQAIATSEAGPGSVPMHGSGVYNGRTGRTALRLTMEIPGHEPIAVRGVSSGSHTFMRSSLFSTLPAGKRWLGVELGTGGSTQNELGGSGDLTEQLKMLQATSDDVDNIGDAEVQGVPTTAYRGTVDLGRYADLLREEGDAAAARVQEKVAELVDAGPEVTVWVDSEEVMRAMRVVEPIPSMEGRPGGSMETEFNFSDFDSDPHVDLPDPRSVFETTAMGHAELGLLDGSTIHFPAPSAGARRLPRGAYRERANSICRRLTDEGRARTASTKPAAERLGEIKRRLGARAALEALPAYMQKYVDPEIAWLGKAYGRFTRLPPPPALAAQVERLNRLSAIQMETLQAYSQATEVEDLRLVKKIAPLRKVQSERANRLARSIGLGECGKEDSGQ